MNRLLYTLFLCCLFVFASNAQEKTLKFGKIDMNNLKMTVYDKDSSAEAVVLADKGFSSLEWNINEGGFFLSHKRHVRVKILTKDGYDRADVSISLYGSGGNREKVSGFKAATYNLEGNKMQTTKLSRKAVFREQVSDKFTNEKFTFPNVKEGSIIEYTYTMNSPYFFNLQDWRFQDDIPTIWSEYIVQIPEYYRYERFAQGFHAMTINDSKVKRDVITFKGGDRLDINTTVYHWLAVDVPAFREEPYMASVKNYISEINFEIASTKFPDSPIKRYMGTWNDMNATFLKDERFGKMASGSGFLTEEVAAIIGGKENDSDKILAIVNNVKSRVSWNKSYSRYASGTLRQVLKNGEGNVADVNLLLTNMLRKAGFQADPVLISTRAHGFVREQFALSSQFNYVVSAVNVGGGVLLLDATDKTLPSTLIPQRCINGRGWRVSESRPGWVDITSGGVESTLVSANMKLSADGTLSGSSDMVFSDYRARRMRGQYFSEEDKFEESYSESKGWEIKDMSMEGMEELSKPVKLKCDLEMTDGVEVLGDLIYFNPFITEKIDENPFKLESREYPVDFISPQRMRYIVTLEIPEGYAVEELPKSEVVALPDNAGKFTYYMQQADGKISFRSSISINKRLFNALEYPYLKQFYGKIVEKQAEQIVLKKVN